MATQRLPVSEDVPKLAHRTSSLEMIQDEFEAERQRRREREREAEGKSIVRN